MSWIPFSGLTLIRGLAVVDEVAKVHYDTDGNYVPARDRRRPIVTQITIHGLDDELEEVIRTLAERDGTSLSHAACELLRIGAGLAKPTWERSNVGSSLDQYIGSWTGDEADEFDAAVREFETIDETAWQ